MLGLPIYLRGSVYYFHTRINGKQVKKSLNTSNKTLAMVRACQILELKLIKKMYSIDLGRMIFSDDGQEDHERLMEALGVIKGGLVDGAVKKPSVDLPSTMNGLRLGALLDKMLNLKTFKEATIVSYKFTTEEFSKFLKNPIINSIHIGDITRYQEYLAKNGNTTRTIDNKVSILRALFNFAIKQGYYFEKNPAENRSLQSKKDKIKGGFGIFSKEEIKKIYRSEYFKESSINDKDYYWTLVLAAITGCRISEITSLKSSNFKVSEENIAYIEIEDSKTIAGIRKIPIPDILRNMGLSEFIQDKNEIFKYKMRLGKGSGNAVGKKFKRHLEEVKIEGDKLVFHSIRKFFNNFLMNNGVDFETRCQVVGHEINSVNIQIYTDTIPIEKVNERIKSSQFNILMIIGMIETEF